MNKEILIDENRTLKLKNVISLTINVTNLKNKEQFNNKVIQFDNYLKNNNLTQIGPLITETVIIGGDEPKILMKLIRQIKETHKPTIPYEFVNELKTDICLYSRFEGQEANASIAQSKMQVYAYEKSLILDTTSYQVHLERDSDNNVVLDTFIGILGRTS